MVEKGNEKREFEKVIIDFEKRQDQKLKGFEERVVNQFHIISEGLIDQIKLLAEGHAGSSIDLKGWKRKMNVNTWRLDHLSSSLLLNLTGGSLTWSSR